MLAFFERSEIGYPGYRRLVGFLVVYPGYPKYLYSIVILLSSLRYMPPIHVPCCHLLEANPREACNSVEEAMKRSTDGVCYIRTDKFGEGKYWAYIFPGGRD